MTPKENIYQTEGAELRRICALVGEAKTKSGLTYREFAALTGVSQDKQGPCVSGLAEYNFTALTLLRVARVLGLTLSQFLSQPSNTKTK